MSIIIFHEGDGSEDMPPYNFELVGVMDIHHAQRIATQDQLVNFFMKEHPARPSNQYKPVLILSVDPENEQNDTPFGIFLATESANPGSDRQLISDSTLHDYRARHPFLQLLPEWKSWQDVEAYFQQQNKEEVNNA